MCRSCACITGEPYRYPESPWTYCSRSGCAMSEQEQVVALARLQREVHLPPRLVPVSGAGAPAPTSEKPLMTVKDVGALLSKSNQAVHKMIERGQLPGVTRVGRRVYVRRADLLRSLAEGRVPSPGRSR